MRHPLLLPVLLTVPAMIAPAQVSVGISLPGISIGINQPTYPDLVPVPGYPVYYAPGADSNYFFYDGLYWVFQNDNWYSSTWYNGPWDLVGPAEVPYFILRIPVHYYRQPPPFFGGWDRNAPPRWGDHWGPGWQQRHGGWDHWDRQRAPAPAPLPTYQRQFQGGRYPRPEQQQALHGQNYHFQPREAADRNRVLQQGGRGNPGRPEQHGPAAPPPRGAEPPRQAPMAQRPEPAHGEQPPRQAPAPQRPQPERRPPQQRAPEGRGGEREEPRP